MFGETSLILHNTSSRCNNAKWFLDNRTADVYFTFSAENEDIVKVPAHKIILATISQVFEAMFYGPVKQEGDIPIVDSTQETFIEFLQLFYVTEVKLTSKNIVAVMNLCKQYMLDESIKLCSYFVQKTITLDNVCEGYDLAIFFDQEDLKKFCEQKIAGNATEILQSNNLLSYNQDLLRIILQLDSLDCDESVVFERCIDWAKANCAQKNLDENNMNNLRFVLGELFYDIRFGDMTLGTFNIHNCLYKGLFSLEEIKDIENMITLKDYKSEKFNCKSRIPVDNFVSNPSILALLSGEDLDDLDGGDSYDYGDIDDNDEIYDDMNGEFYENNDIEDWTDHNGWGVSEDWIENDR